MGAGYCKRNDIPILRKSYEQIAEENAKELYYNFHSQKAYIKGYMDAVDRYIKPKKRSEDELKAGSMLNNY